MAITSANDFFEAVPTRLVTLSTGIEVCICALNVDAYEFIEGKQDAEPDPIKAGTIFSLYAMLFSIVHPETHKPLFTEEQLPRLRQNLAVADYEHLVSVINEINGFGKKVAEEPDPVKKPETALVTSATYVTG